MFHLQSHHACTALIACALLVSLQAATTSPQQADLFSQKVARIQQQADSPKTAGPLRTSLSQDELNSWIAYRGQSKFPAGVSQLQLNMLGQGRVTGQAIVDLGEVGKRRTTGGAFDPWSYVGGRVPLTITGVLRSQNGMARFDMEEAHVSGVPVPSSMLQELVGYYSRTERQPMGIRLDETFELPANIRQIEVGQGSAVVVQ